MVLLLELRIKKFLKNNFMNNYSYKQFKKNFDLVIKKEKKYFFYGENNFSMIAMVDFMIKKLVNAYKETVYAGDLAIEQIYSKLSTATLFSEKTVIVLRNYDISKKKFRSSLIDFIKNYTCEQYFIIMYEKEIPYYEKQKDDTIKYLLNNTVAVNFSNFTKQEIIDEFIPENCNKDITQEGKELLYENVGHDMWLLYNELQKISYCDISTNIVTESDIKKHCSVYEVSEIKDLLSNIENHDISKSLAVLNILFSTGIEPIHILVAIYRYFRKQFLWGKFQPTKSYKILKELYDTDYKLKSTNNKHYIIETSVLNLCKIMNS